MLETKMAGEDKRIENMDKYYSDVTSFFKNVQINGSLNQRAKTVKEFLDRKSGTHFVIANKPYGNYAGTIMTTSYSQFTNNGVDYIIGELEEQRQFQLTAKSAVEDFQKNVIFAAYSAETKGGTLSEKIKRFNEIFKESVNLIVAKESEAGVHFSYRYGCSFSETRNGTTYTAWLF